MAICVMDDVLEHSPAGAAKYAPLVRAVHSTSRSLDVSQ